MNQYLENIIKCNTMLGERGYTFIGQGVEVGGTFMSATLEGVPLKQRKEFKVSEGLQMSYSLGRALGGDKICSIFPRNNFLLCAMSELVNCVDKIPKMAQQDIKLIIVSGQGTTTPVFPGEQHSDDLFHGINSMLKYTKTYCLLTPNQVLAAYEEAVSLTRPVYIHHYGDLYYNDTLLGRK